MPRVACYDGPSVNSISPSVCKASDNGGTRGGWHNFSSTCKLPSRWHHVIRDFQQRTKWSSALRTQMIVMRNAAASVACAWLVNACYSLGNIFSYKPSREQSRRELIVSNSFWASITFCTIMLLAQIPLLLSLRFIDAPDRRPTCWFCLKKLVRATTFYFFSSMAVMLGWSCFIGYLATANPALFRYKFECYLNTLAVHGYFTGITLATKKIYYRESVQGRDRLVRAQRTSTKSKRSDKKLEGPSAQERLASVFTPLSRRKEIRSYWRAYVREFPKSAPAALAGMFVHVLSQQRIMDRSNMIITCFIIASVVFKLTIQESIKRYILKKRIRSLRIMCAAVALPTVLIDTQARIILLGTQSTNLLALGALGMALFEIFLRVGKAHFLVRSIRNRMRQRSTLKSSHQHVVNSRSPTPSQADFALWRGRVQAYHMAEINADTYAEYIAIGCSASILVFFGDHPHYSLLRRLNYGEQTIERSTQLRMLGFQVVVELVVDFVATSLEMMAGVEFAMDKNVAAFLAIFLAAIAVLNINISVGVYLF